MQRRTIWYRNSKISLARVVSAAGVQPTRPGSIPVEDNPRVSPGKIPQREAERVCGVC